MRVAVLTARYGSGHRIAARGVIDALEHFGVEYHLMDMVDEGGAVERISSAIYEYLMRRGHTLWSLLYDSRLLASGPMRRIYALLMRRLAEELKEISPDAVVSTHFLTSLAAVMYGRRAFTVITDFSVHPLWVWEGTDRYYVASERTAEEPILRGKDVRITGIPLRKGFWEPMAKDRARAELGYPQSSKVVLLSAGSYASVKVEPLLRILKREGAFVVLLAGRRESAYRRFKRLLSEEGIGGVVYPFVDFVPKIMAASDLFITKAGGVSVAEALAVGLPMLFLDNMPGQEEMNARIVEEEGAGINARTVERASEILPSLLGDEGRLGRMRESAKRLGRPKAALSVVEDMLR
ncbi:MAG: hypothetical protein GXO29_01530 [Thermotogae bacterium]|nr:hypothetical protein [Thermotogota bacterium]